MGIFEMKCVQQSFGIPKVSFQSREHTGAMETLSIMTNRILLFIIIHFIFSSMSGQYKNYIPVAHKYIKQ